MNTCTNVAQQIARVVLVLVKTPVCGGMEEKVTGLVVDSHEIFSSPTPK
jgi:hypothetical protein